MSGNISIQEKNSKPIFIFILAWIAINIVQSIFTGIYTDEAYYWVYSRHLQWGYFDHPPLVALFVKAGELFGHSSFTTRIGTVLLSGSAVFFLFKAIPEEYRDQRIYITSFLSVILFHVYGFVATPDAALFFFTALFFYAYRLYLQRQSLAHTTFLALCMAGLLYSKYHGAILLFFVFLSNPKLIFKPTAWLAVFLAALIFIPHLYWQYQHDWPTFRYHLSERVASRYRISKTTNYILGQLVVWGPLTVIPLFYRLLKLRNTDVYLRAHQFSIWGVLVFFLLSSFKSAIEPHWTLVAGVSFIVLAQIVLVRSGEKFLKLFTRLAFINIGLALIIRVMLMLPSSPIARSNNLKPIFYGKAWADSIYKHAGNSAIVFTDSYGLPALYQYHHPDVITTSFNTIGYRKNHYSISGDEALLNNKTVYLYSGVKKDSADIYVSNPYTNVYLHRIDSFNAVNALKFEWINPVKKVKTGETIRVLVRLRNTGNHAIDAGVGLSLSYTFFKTRKERITSEPVLLKEEKFSVGYEKDIELLVKTPGSPGKYRLVFSIVSPPFDPSLASNYFAVTVQ